MLRSSMDHFPKRLNVHSTGNAPGLNFQNQNPVVSFIRLLRVQFTSVDIVFRLENNSSTRESFIKLTADLIEQKTYSRNPCRNYPFN